MPILCVGETLAERDAGATEAVIARQLDAVVARAGIDAFSARVVAYEPVWAIGTGRTATPEQAQAVHAFIRDKLAGLDGTIAGSLRLLYGGSVKPSNAAELFGQPDVDGGLIGGASLVAEDFLAICVAADRRNDVTGRAPRESRDLQLKRTRMISIIANVFYVLIAVAMIVLILLQRGAGAAAGSGFGGGASATVFGARGSANFLSRSTAVLAALFFLLSLGMGIYLGRQGTAPRRRPTISA